MLGLRRLPGPGPFVQVGDGDPAVVVQALHEPEEGQLVEEDLRDLHKEVLSTVLESAPHKLTQRVLEGTENEVKGSTVDLLFSKLF